MDGRLDRTISPRESFSKRSLVGSPKKTALERVSAGERLFWNTRAYNKIWGLSITSTTTLNSLLTRVFSLFSNPAGKPAIGGPWSLVDLEGNLVTDKSFEGKWLLLYFGFARCPDICPSEMMKVGRVMDTLKEKHPELYKKVVPLFVSVDPARDSLQALKTYAKDFHPDYVFLTGSPIQVQKMAKMYRVYVSKADETADGDYLIDHSIVIYFHDDTGDLADCFTQSMRPTDVVQKMVRSPTVV
jgi:protein SCO1/2